jgi:hypothetical protein
MIRFQGSKGYKNVFNLSKQQIKKMANAYNSEGPKGPEV